MTMYCDDRVTIVDGNVVVELSGSHDAITTASPGFVKGVRRIVIGTVHDSFDDGTLYLSSHAPAESCSVSRLSVDRTAVTAISIADIGSGLGRAGEMVESMGGGITTVMLLGCDCPESTLVRAGITMTEGITVALEDLEMDVTGSVEKASGCVRQSITVVRDNGSPYRLRGAGKHSKLGEIIGRSTINSVTASASKNGVSNETRNNLCDRLSRFGMVPENMSNLLKNYQDEDMFTLCISIIHLEDECRWGLIPRDVATVAARTIIEDMLHVNVEPGSPVEMLKEALIRIDG